MRAGWGGRNRSADLDGETFRLGVWTVDPLRHKLRRDGAWVVVEPHSMDVLVELAARPNQRVSLVEDPFAFMFHLEGFIQEK